MLAKSNFKVAPTLITLATTLLLAGAACATGPEPVVVAPEPDGAFLWRVEGPNGPSHLFGTIHMGVDAGELAPVVSERLRASPIAVFEADVRTVNPFEVMRLAMYTGDGSLDAFFDDEQWSRLVAAVGDVIPEATLRQYRPWFLFTVILQSMHPTSEPMDMALLNAAEQNLSELRFLETWQEQMGIMSALPDESMVEDILEWVDDRESVDRELATMIDGYRSGNTTAVAEVVLSPEDMARWPDQYESLIFERNRQWIAPIEELVAEGGAFIAVGLGHLVGDGSVIDLLRQRGYTITRVTD